MLKRSRKEGERREIGEGNHIKWDEATIAEHDKERGTRQKIDEPPTPYHYGSDEDEDLGHGQVRESGAIDVNKYRERAFKKHHHHYHEQQQQQQQHQNSSHPFLENWEMLRAKLQYEQAKQQGEDEFSSRGSVSISSSPDESLHSENVTRSNEVSIEQRIHCFDKNEMKHSGGDKADVFDIITYDFDHEPKRANSDFAKKRNAHYNEFQIMKAMRSKVTEDEEDGDEEVDDEKS